MIDVIHRRALSHARRALQAIVHASSALAAVVGLGLLAPLAHAELVATPLPGDSRLVQFEYDQDNTFLVLTRPKAVTHIEFGADEQILTVAGGDTKHWELTPTANRRHLFVKPVYEQMETSMTVLTDKRSYQFVLRSTGSGAKWYQRVSWQYSQKTLIEFRAEEEQRAAARDKPAAPAEVQARAEAQRGSGVPLDQLNFDYQIEGNAAFRPTTIFSDGRFTWIRLPAETPEWPALFSVTEENDAAVVNYIVKGEYMVAQQVMNRGILKLGKSVVKFNRTDVKRGGLFGTGFLATRESP